ncbi:MAG TPA: helix-turn-helix transcriptional regulator [Planctomycetota bacterium]
MKKKREKAEERRAHRDTTVRRFAQRLRNLRVQRGWSQEELAKRAKIQQHHISSLERSGAMPSLLTLELIARAFEMDLSEFLAFPEIATPASDRMHEELAMVCRALKKHDIELVRKLRKVVESLTP